MKVRVRFAPSPTGFLHIGGARTALFNWLYARHTGGVYVLRIEDTDASRNTQEAVDLILNGLRWLGLEWDEGPLTGAPDGPHKGDYGPYFQSQRMPIYQRHVEELKKKGHAYEHEGAVKFRMEREPILIEDMVVGNVRRELTDRESVDPDFVITRSDGQPVFHLVNVVDDLEMGITHVIRGEDHLANTAKHLALFRALGAPPPKYAHIPLILNKDGTKMSKREAGASLYTYVEGGYAPEAIVNYLCLLGWSPKDDRQVLPLGDVIKLFDLPQILRHNARFDMTKLLWMNGEYLRAMELDRFVLLGVDALERSGLNLKGFEPAYIKSALATAKEKVKTLNELPLFTDFYFNEVAVSPELEAELPKVNKPALLALRQALAATDNWTAQQLEVVLKDVARQLEVKAGALVHPARVACTGRTVGPSLYHLLETLGKDQVLARVDAFIRLLP